MFCTYIYIHLHTSHLVPGCTSDVMYIHTYMYIFPCIYFIIMYIYMYIFHIFHIFHCHEYIFHCHEYIDVYISLSCIYIYTHLYKFHRKGWRRPIGCLQSQVMFRKRATIYRALLRKMTYTDKASYDSTPPCVYIYTYMHIFHLDTSFT